MTPSDKTYTLTIERGGVREVKEFASDMARDAWSRTILAVSLDVVIIAWGER